MPIRLQCPGCDTWYEVRDDLIGKRVKCKCGTEMTVPRESDGLPRELEIDEEAQQQVLSPSRPGGAVASEGHGAATDGRPRRPRPPETGSPVWRIVVGVLSIVYGTAATVGIAAVAVKGGLGVWILSSMLLALSVSIVAGGVLILKRHRHGPACAGLCCLFLCFVPLWYLVILLLSAFSTKDMVTFLLVLLVIVVFFSAPAVITVWCLRQEMAKQKPWEPPL